MERNWSRVRASITEIPFLGHTVKFDQKRWHRYDKPIKGKPIKDDTLPCKRQALAWQKEPKAWTQAFFKQFLSVGCVVKS